MTQISHILIWHNLSRTLIFSTFQNLRPHLLLQGIRPLDIQVHQLPPPRRCLDWVTQLKSLLQLIPRFCSANHHRHPQTKSIDIQGEIHRHSPPSSSFFWPSGPKLGRTTCRPYLSTSRRLKPPRVAAAWWFQLIWSSSPFICRVSYMSGGVGFLPSTVWLQTCHFWLQFLFGDSFNNFVF